MLLSEIKPFTTSYAQSNGTYAAVVPSDSTLALLRAWADDARISLDQNLHVTLLYSRVVLNFQVSAAEHIAQPLEFIVLGKALVLRLVAPTIEDRHFELINLGGTHDFPDFIPHLTLVTDPDELSIADLPAIDFGLAFGNEYSEELVL